MKQSAESANMVLESNLITFQPNTPIQFTYNVDMKTVLGDMYDKYKYFKIVLNSTEGFGGAAYSYTPANTVCTDASV